MSHVGKLTDQCSEGIQFYFMIAFLQFKDTLLV